MAKNVILAENTQTTLLLDAYGVYGFVIPFNDTSLEFPLTLGDECVVVWDGEDYSVTVGDSSEIIADTLFVGNGSAFGLHGNNEPFVIAWDSTGATCVSLTDTTETSHTVAIYQNESETEEEITVGIVLKNYNGEDVTYTGVEKVKFNTSDGCTAIFSKGEAVENVPIELNFAGGDMAVTAENGTLVKSAVIKKPIDLVPENIVKGASIAGVEGNSTGGEKVDKVVTLYMADGDQIIEADDGTVIGSVTVKKPPNLTPNNIISGVDIGGVIGEYTAAKLAASNSFNYSTNNNKQCFAVYRGSDNGYFPIACVLYVNDPPSELIRSPIATTPGNIYWYADDMVDVEPMKLENIQVRFEGNGFSPSDFKTYSKSLYLVGTHFDLKNCAFDTDVYTRYFSGSTISTKIIPDSGAFLPRSVSVKAENDGETFTVDATYDEFSGVLNMVVPETKYLSVNAIAEDHQWLHSPSVIIDDEQKTLAIDYIDGNAVNTTVVCDGAHCFDLIDDRTGMLSYDITEKVDGASFGFELQSDGYYKTTSNSTYKADVCRVYFNMRTESTVTLQYVNYGYSSYDYGIISKVDCPLSTSYSADIDTSSSNVYTTFKSSNSSTAKTLSLTIPAGKHFIDFKYRRYYSSSTGYYFKFKITTEAAPAPEPINLVNYFPNYGYYALQIQSHSDGWSDSLPVIALYSNQPIISVAQHVVTVDNILPSVSSFDVVVDDAVVDNLVYDGTSPFAFDLAQYNLSIAEHSIYVNAICDGAPTGKSNIISDQPLFTYSAFSDASWEEIDTIGKAGWHTRIYSIGDTKQVKYDTSVTIAGFDHDELSDGSGYAPISLVWTYVTPSSYTIRNIDYNSSNRATYWTNSTLRESIVPAIAASLPVEFTSVVKSVKKAYNIVSGSGNTYTNTTGYSNDTFWPISTMECGLTTNNWIGSGTTYEGFASGIISRSAKRYDLTTASMYWTRDSRWNDSYSYWGIINADGSMTTSGTSNPRALRLGCCI